MYRDRVYLCALHFITESKDLVGGIMLINTVDTAASMCEKLLEDMLSYIRLDTSQNMLCFDKEKSSAGEVVITFLGVVGNIDLQKEIDDFFQPISKSCVSINCNRSREVVTKPTNHIVVELLSIPKASGKYSHLENTTTISQNYTEKVLLKLEDISKTITIIGDVYNLRGVIAFGGSERELRQSYSHYIAYGLRSNDQWQCYDDLKDQVSTKSKSFKVNAEILFYTK
ncbi:hypothetical protein QTP88_029577 [Uroleucon formosanum]